MMFIFAERQYIGYPAVHREHTDTVKKAILLTDPGQTVTRSGTLVAWDLYIAPEKTSHVVYLQIWRPVRPDAEQPVYALKGQIRFVSEREGHIHQVLHPKDRQTVNPGDLIGLHFTKFCPIPYNSVKCGAGNIQLFRYNPRLVDPNKQFYFMRSQMDWIPCRHYSYNATIVDERGMT